MATVESTYLCPPRGSDGRLHLVTVGVTPGGGHADYLASDVIENDVNSRRVDSLIQVGYA